MPRPFFVEKIAMTNVVNPRPCKWSERDVQFAKNIALLLADDLKRQGYLEAAEIVRGWLIPFTMKGLEP